MKNTVFMTLYVLLLYVTLPIEQMAKRILSLIFSSIIIIILCYVLTKYDFNKMSNNQII